MGEPVIVCALRSPIGEYGGIFKNTHPAELASKIVKEALSRINIKPEEVDEVIFGIARQAGQGPNLARQISVAAGIPYEIPAYTVNKACGSSIQTVILGYQAIKLNEANIIVTGGVESMSRTPYILDKARFNGYRLGDGELIDGMYRDGLYCPISHMLPGETAEILAEKYNISRIEQDEYALKSHQRAYEATKNNKFKEEIVSFEIKIKNEKKVVDYDEHIRKDTSFDQLANLPPVFKEGGTVTAGNTCGMGDGAAVVILTSEEIAKKKGIKPIAKIDGYASVGIDPKLMGMGPIPATKKLFQNTNTKLDDYDLFELNEAFAAQVLAVKKEIPFPDDRTNVNGGAIALGHPIGCTGARLITTLLHEMRRRKAKRGMVTLGIGGGMGMSIAFSYYV
jgi:acetyl-CoA C-acetyltransferase